MNRTPDQKYAAHIVFLSNEKQPVVLEKDDRRFAVVWCRKNCCFVVLACVFISPLLLTLAIIRWAP